MHLARTEIQARTHTRSIKRAGNSHHPTIQKLAVPTPSGLVLTVNPPQSQVLVHLLRTQHALPRILHHDRTEICPIQQHIVQDAACVENSINPLLHLEGAWHLQGTPPALQDPKRTLQHCITKTHASKHTRTVTRAQPHISKCTLTLAHARGACAHTLTHASGACAQSQPLWHSHTSSTLALQSQSLQRGRTSTSLRTDSRCFDHLMVSSCLRTGQSRGMGSHFAHNLPVPGGFEHITAKVYTPAELLGALKGPPPVVTAITDEVRPSGGVLLAFSIIQVILEVGVQRLADHVLWARGHERHTLATDAHFRASSDIHLHSSVEPYDCLVVVGTSEARRTRTNPPGVICNDLVRTGREALFAHVQLTQGCRAPASCVSANIVAPTTQPRQRSTHAPATHDTPREELTCPMAHVPRRPNPRSP